MKFKEYINEKINPSKDYYPLKPSDFKKIINAFPEINKIIVMTKSWMPFENDWYGKAYQFQIDCKINIEKIDMKKLGKGSLINARVNYVMNNLSKEIATWINVNIKPKIPAVPAGCTIETRTSKASVSINFIKSADEHRKEN